MTDSPPTLRDDRLKAALRDNLRRRKAQARARTDKSESSNTADEAITKATGGRREDPASA